MKSNVVRKAQVVSREIVFSESQLELIRIASKDAKKAIEESTDYHLAVADIVLKLHKNIFGETTPVESEEGRMLIALFAKNIEFTMKSVRNWMRVKINVVDKLKDRVEDFSYNQLLDIESRMRINKKSLTQSFNEVKEQMENPSIRDFYLADRYSKELLGVYRRISMCGGRNKSIEVQISYRLGEVKRLMSRIK